VSDHNKVIAYPEGTTRVTPLVRPKKQEARLEPTGNRFAARGSLKFRPGAKAVAQVTAAVKGKVSTPRVALKLRADQAIRHAPPLEPYRRGLLPAMEGG